MAAARFYLSRDSEVHNSARFARKWPCRLQDRPGARGPPPHHQRRGTRARVCRFCRTGGAALVETPPCSVTLRAFPHTPSRRRGGDPRRPRRRWSAVPVCGHLHTLHLAGSACRGSAYSLTPEWPVQEVRRFPRTRPRPMRSRWRGPPRRSRGMTTRLGHRGRHQGTWCSDDLDRRLIRLQVVARRIRTRPSAPKRVGCQQIPPAHGRAADRAGGGSMGSPPPPGDRFRAIADVRPRTSSTTRADKALPSRASPRAVRGRCRQSRRSRSTTGLRPRVQISEEERRRQSRQGEGPQRIGTFEEGSSAAEASSGKDGAREGRWRPIVAPTLLDMRNR